MIYHTVQVDPPWLERGGGKSKRGADKHYPLLPTPQILEVIVRSPMNMADNSHMWMWVTDNFLKDGLWLMENLGFRYIRTWQWVKVKGKPRRLDFETGWAVGPEHAHGCRVDEQRVVLPQPGTNIYTVPAGLGHCTCGAQAEFDLTLRYGIGQYARGAHEMMLFGVAGKGQDPAVCTERRDIPSVFFAPVPKDNNNLRIHSRKPDAAYELIEARSRGPYLELFARRGYSPAWTSWGNEIEEAP